MILRVLMTIFFCFFSLLSTAQYSSLLLGKSYSSSVNKLIYSSKHHSHTSFKPIFQSDLNFDIDSIIKSKNKKKSTDWFNRKLYQEHFFKFSGHNHDVFISPIINLTLGKDRISNKNTSNNTRGYILGGKLGEKITFSSSFLETQSVFSDYLEDFISNKRVVPGQGYVREFKENGFDYAMSSGYVLFRPNNIFSFQFGHGKHFIGDGYRSLILSDNSFNYPFLRIQTTFGKIQYTNLFAEFQDINYFLNNSIDDVDQIGFPKKYMSSHYLSLKASSKFNISIYEAVIWRMNHAPGNSTFDINYLNPIIFFRPVEFSINSPDNVLIGLNMNYKLPITSYLYAQFIIDEFSLTELRRDNGFWANKYSFQMGYKIFNFLNLENFTAQIEYNYVRPYTYAHHNPLQNYAHYNQSLAHPLGANFVEKLLLLNYKFKRWELSAKIISAKSGRDFEGSTTSFGSDVYKSTGSFSDESGIQNIGSGRPSDFGINMFQGNLTFLDIKSLDLSYIINPKTNLKFNIGFILRSYKDEMNTNSLEYINIGVKSDLFNNYYDF